MSIKTKGINLASKLLVKLSVIDLIGKFNKTPRIIYYHGIEDNIIDQYIQGVQINSQVFKKNLQYIKDKHKVISISEFYERFKNNSFEGNEVVITFDDGYKNNLTIAAPILKELEMPFTVFLSTNLIDNPRLRFPTFIIRSVILKIQRDQIYLKSLGGETIKLGDKNDRKEKSQLLIRYAKQASNSNVNLLLEEILSNMSHDEIDIIFSEFESEKPMNWKEARLLMSYGCTLASHCEDHFICHDTQDENEMFNQLINSRQKIKEIQGHCDFFAYPNGTNCELARKLVLKAGYKMAFTTKMGAIDKLSDPYIINRVPVPLDENRFILRMSI